MGFNSRNNRGNEKYRRRAKEIYEWALTVEGNFRMAELPTRHPYDSESISMLIERGLIAYSCKHRNMVTYRVIKRVPVEQCLDLNGHMPMLKGCKVYRVHPNVAENMATAPNLEKYALNGVTQW